MANVSRRRTGPTPKKRAAAASTVSPRATAAPHSAQVTATEPDARDGRCQVRPGSAGARRPALAAPDRAAGSVAPGHVAAVPDRAAASLPAAVARIAAAPVARPHRRVRAAAKRPRHAAGARPRPRPGRAARRRSSRRPLAAALGRVRPRSRSRRAAAALRTAAAEGRALAHELRAAPGGAPKGQALQRALNAAFSRTRQAERIALQAALQEGAAFRAAFAQSWGQTLPPYVLLPLRGRAAAVVTVRNEEEAIQQVLQELALLPLQDTIVVINGSTDHSFRYAREFAGVTIIHEPTALGLDVGRALGARMTDADIVLFVDGDFPVAARELAAFLLAVDHGIDVALNDVMPYLSRFAHWDAVSRVKQFLNSALGRADLGANSLTCIPHALSRRAIRTVGEPSLAVPPKAQAAALNAKLKTAAVASINVFAKNRRRKQNIGAGNPVARLILGDHIEALHSVQRTGGARLGFADRVRRRTMAGG